MMGICKACNKNMQFRTRNDTIGMYLEHLFEVWHIFLSFDADLVYTRYIFLKFGYDKDMTRL